jgi:hypothetical protein
LTDHARDGSPSARAIAHKRPHGSVVASKTLTRSALSQRTLEGEIMNWKEIEGRWNQFTSQISCNPGKPTDEHIAVTVANPIDDADAQKVARAGPEEAPQPDAEATPVLHD